MNKNSLIYHQGLKLSLNVFLEIFEHMPLGVQVYDNNGLSFLMNENMSRFLGLPDKSYSVGKFNALNDPFALDNGIADMLRRALKGEMCERTYTYNLEAVSSTWKTRPESRTFKEKFIPIYDDENTHIAFVACIIDDITDKLRDEKKLVESEERFKAIFKQDRSIKLMIDSTTGQIEDINQAAIDFYGYSEEEFKKMCIQEINILSSEEIKQEMDNAVRMERNYFSFKHRTRNGDIRDVSVYSSPITFNNSTKLFSIVHDVTVQKEAESKLLESERRWKFALEGYDHGLWDWDIQNNSVYFSTKWKSMLGFSDSEVDGTFEAWSSRIHPDDSDEALQNLNEHLEDRTKFFESEQRVMCKDGSYTWFYTRGVIVERDTLGKPKRVIGIQSDISKRKETERKLVESQVKFKTIFQIANIGLTLTDEKGNIIDCNIASERILGISKEEHLARNYAGKEWSIIRPDGSPMPPDEFASVRAMKENKPIFNVEMGLVLPEGVRWISVSASPLWLEGLGVLIGYVDITELKKKETQLRELIATKDKLFSIISHDLRNPFNLIMGFAELAKSDILNKEYDELETYFKRIQESAEQSYSLLNNLLEWSRLQTGLLSYQPETLHVRTELLKMKSFFKTALIGKDLTLSIHADENLHVEADDYMIETVLRNILSNAIKFSFSGGEIVAQAKQVDTRCVISIADQGIGISKSNVNRIFDSGEVFTTQGTQSEKGTGLGLILCKEFIEKHNGKMWIESKEGKGTTVFFSLSIAPPNSH